MNRVTVGSWSRGDPALPRRLGRLIIANLAKLTLSMGIVLALVAPAFGIQDDQIPWGPEGTIGRGSGPIIIRGLGGLFNRVSRPGFEEQLPGVSYYPMSPTYPYVRGYSSPPMGYSTWGAPRPYLTNRFYEPGDGYRYPLYYNPANRSYFYYPVHR